MIAESESLTFASLLEMASGMSADMFAETIRSPLLVATGLLAGAVRTNQKDRDTDVVEIEGRPAHSKGPHPLAGSILAVRKHVRTSPGKIMVGRGPENDLVVDERSVSKWQAYFERQAELLFLVDLGSRNGTFVNLERLAKGQPKSISDEDLITFGRVSFQFFTPTVLFLALKAFREGAT